MEIKKIRQNLMMTQEQFAKAIGVTRCMVAFWEKGKYKPSLKNMKKILELKGDNK